MGKQTRDFSRGRDCPFTSFLLVLNPLFMVCHLQSNATKKCCPLQNGQHIFVLNAFQPTSKVVGFFPACFYNEMHSFTISENIRVIRVILQDRAASNLLQLLQEQIVVRVDQRNVHPSQLVSGRPGKFGAFLYAVVFIGGKCAACFNRHKVHFWE